MAISNPRGANTFVSDFRTGRGDDGRIIEYGQTTISFRANVAIKRGEIVGFVAPTQTNPLSVGPAFDPGYSTGYRVTGVAVADCAAGDLVRVCVSGHCLVLTGVAVSALNAVLCHSSTAGRAATVASVDATIPSGSVLGTFLADGTANTLVPIWLKPLS